MIRDRWEYVRAETLAGALTLLASRSDAYPLAGGTDLVIAGRLGRIRGGVAVDISAVPELQGITAFPTEAGGVRLRIGAATTVSALLQDELVQQKLPALVDAGRLLGGWQIQNLATVGGNMCNASPSAELSPPLLVHRAEAVIAGPEGSRRLGVDRFWTGPGKTALARGELLVAVELETGGASAYVRHQIRRSVDIALASAAAWVSVEDERIAGARLALGAVAPAPLLVEVAEEVAGVPVRQAPGKEPDDPGAFGPALAKRLQRVERLAFAAARPITDVRASADYRRAVVGVLARRALLRAVQRALAVSEDVETRSG